MTMPPAVQVGKSFGGQVFGARTLLALIAMGGALLGAAAALANDSVNLALWIAIATPAVVVLGYVGKRAASRLRGLDMFAPTVAFPLLYVLWFAVGSVDLIEVPASLSFGLFEPIPGYVLGYAALGLGAYLAGAALGQKQREAKLPECQWNWLEDRFWLVVVALGFLQMASYVYVVAGMGAIPSLSADAGELRLRITQFGGAEAVLFTCTWTLIPLLMMYVWRRNPRGCVKFSCYAGVAISSLLLVSLGGRSYLFVPLLTTLVARHYAKKRFALGRAAAVAVVLFLCLSFFGYLRDSAMDGHEYGEDRMGISGSVMPFIYAYFYVRYPVATFRDITEIIPAKVPYQWGQLTFGPLATLLPGHHEQSDMFFKNILGNDFIGAGQPATLLGPLYADAGLFGVVAGLFFAGMLIAWARQWMMAQPGIFRILIYGWLMQTLLFSLFANLFPYITTLWMPLFWMLLERCLRKPSHGRQVVTVPFRLRQEH
jgi:oligosaccharide repeat unit polymerase